MSHLTSSVKKIQENSKQFPESSSWNSSWKKTWGDIKTAPVDLLSVIALWDFSKVEAAIKQQINIDKDNLNWDVANSIESLEKVITEFINAKSEILKKLSFLTTTLSNIKWKDYFIRWYDNVHFELSEDNTSKLNALVSTIDSFFSNREEFSQLSSFLESKSSQPTISEGDNMEDISTGVLDSTETNDSKLDSETEKTTSNETTSQSEFSVLDHFNEPNEDNESDLDLKDTSSDHLTDVSDSQSEDIDSNWSVLVGPNNDENQEPVSDSSVDIDANTSEMENIIKMMSNKTETHSNEIKYTDEILVEGTSWTIPPHVDESDLSEWDSFVNEDNINSTSDSESSDTIINDSQEQDTSKENSGSHFSHFWSDEYDFEEEESDQDEKNSSSNLEDKKSDDNNSKRSAFKFELTS